MTLPAAVPEVSFDPKLGSEFRNLDFDYHSFYAMARSADISDVSISELKIYYSSKILKSSHIFMPMALYGKYSRRQKRAIIFPNCIVGDVRFYSDEEQMSTEIADTLNSTAIHEAGHHFEARGTLRSAVRANAYAGGAYVGGLVAMAGLFDTIITRSVPPIATALTFDGLATYLAIKKYGDRRNLPHEKFATAFEAAHACHYLVTSCESR